MTNNLMIGVVGRTTNAFDDLIACFASYIPLNATNDNVTVTNNLCQGSHHHGYAVVDVDCDEIDIYPFAGNTAGSCDIGWISNKGNSTCLASKGLMAYSSTIGHIMNPPNTITTMFKNFIFADNNRSATLRIGGDSKEKVGYIYDSYFSAISRPDCPKCYAGDINYCSKAHAIRMLSTGSNG